MASRLSSLLVRDGLVGVKRMEKAFQRQVIYGGSLDTILLEMGLVPEDRLTQYLALSSGLPPATRAETHVFDPAALKLCTEAIALQHRVAPLQIDDGALRVLVCDPVDMALLEDLADVLDLPVQPLIVPEYRWHVVFARDFDKQAAARFATLAKQAEVATSTAPVGRARTVIVDDPREASDSMPDHVVVDVVETVPESGPLRSAAEPSLAGRASLAPVAPESPTLRMQAVEPEVEPISASALAARAAPTTTSPEPARAAWSAPPRATSASDGIPEPLESSGTPRPRGRDTIHGFAPVGPSATSATGATTSPVTAPTAVTAPITAPVTTAPPAAPNAIPSAVPTAEPTAPTAPMTFIMPASSAPSAPLRRVTRPGTAPTEIEPPPPGDGPISVIVARAALNSADDRDVIFTLLLRALRSRARWAGLLTVQGGAAIGRLAIAEPELDATGVGGVLIPLDSDSAFAAVLETRAYSVGPIATGDPDIDGMLAYLGGAVPPSALLLPIVLRDRVVAVAIAHNVDRELGIADVAELLPLGTVAGDALGRLIVKHKSIGYRALTADPVPVIEIDGGEIPSKRPDRVAAAWSVPDRAATPDLGPDIERGTEVSMTAEPARPIAEVFASLESADEAVVETAINEAVARAAEVLPLIARRFPGKLRVDRYQVSGRALRAAQYGALLDLCVRLGSPVADVLVEKMGDPQRDNRFYATVCAAELRPRNAIYALVERLFDADYGVRACASEALAGYPLRDLDLAMVRCRHALHSDDAERVLAASTAIADLGDVHAIPDLIDTAGRDGKRAEHARRALMSLTKQDFGTSERKWRRWWDEHREQHRIEWLIEALGHKEAPLRQSAAEDLRKLTGEYFGFHHDLPKRDRDTAQGRWRQWWNEVGRRRFVRDDDERSRTTAMLPRTRKD
ncbi:MAG: hypothetical protein K8W52_03215 [Deltaproteobacteria bacterium]|nr:hypothetical protein [Deltaproteobacteria bacterium]